MQVELTDQQLGEILRVASPDPSTTTMDKATILRLYAEDVLSLVAAARSLLLYHILEAERSGRPCTISAALIAAELKADKDQVRLALLRWEKVERPGGNGERGRAWQWAKTEVQNAI